MNQDFVKNCADLVVYDKIFTAEDNQMIHEAQPAATYFEGKKVFSL